MLESGTDKQKYKTAETDYMNLGQWLDKFRYIHLSGGRPACDRESEKRGICVNQVCYLKFGDSES